MGIKEKEEYWRISLIIIVIALGALILWKSMPFLSGILGAITIYILVRRQMEWLTTRHHWRRSLAAAVITIEAILCFLVPLTVAVWLIVNKVEGINLDPQALVQPIEQAINLIEEKTGYDVLSGESLKFILSMLPSVGQFVMNSIAGLLINGGVLIIVLYFMLMGGTKMEAYVSDILPFNAGNTESVMREVNLIVRSNAVGIPLLAIIQGGIAMIGYWIFGVESIWLAGFLTALATVVPMVGTALVWVPIVIFMALSGDWGNAIGLTAYGVLVVAQVDYLIRFLLQKKMADIHPLVTIFGVVIGLSLFGFMGVIFGPVLLSLFLLLVDTFKREYLSGKRL
jgi:predicted PurR-regulated permease PerM